MSLLYLCGAMQSSASSSSRPVAIWVFTGVIMLLVQVVLGGITRLTGSGLSITHWDVFTGTLPPLNNAQWQQAFDGYRQTPQYHILNSGFTLADFKFIFFWEWFHRFWARMVGVVFLVGFAGLVWKKKMKKEMVRPLIILFLLGALQGAIGWIMVASGLTGDAIYVEPTRLALHFVFALGLVVYAFWFALQLSVPGQTLLRTNPGASRPALISLRRWTIALLFVLFFQLLFGALMAGHKAATVAPTWPTINGDWIPDGLFHKSKSSLFEDLIGNKLTVQFIHRGIAYLLLIMVGIWSILAFRLENIPGYFRKLRWLPGLFILVQIVLGITSLLTSPGIIPGRWVAFDWLAQFHQVTGLLFLLTIIGMLYLVKPDIL
jgi:cytochrome c oxidase assembly protein subunit 15